MSAIAVARPPAVALAAPAASDTPRWLFRWAALYLTVIYIRPGEIVPSLMAVPVLDYVTLGALVASGLSLALMPRPFFNQPQDKLLVMFLGLIMISSPVHGWVGGLVPAFQRFFPVVFFYFLVRLGVRTDDQIRSLTRLLVALNLFLAVNGLLQVFTGAGFGNVSAMDTTEGIRIMGTGIFNDPNDLGMTLVLSVPFLLTALSRPGNRLITRGLTLLALGAILTACFYTNSRGTILAIGVMFTAYTYRRKGPVTATLIATFGLIFMLALAPSRMSEMSADEDSAQGRIQAWSEGLQMFKSSPLFGAGYGEFGEIAGLVAHNSFVHVLGELGLPGAMTFVGMFYFYFYGLGRRATTADRTRLRLDLSDSALGMLICMFFLSRQYVVVPYVLVALGACYADRAAPDERRDGTMMSHGAALASLTFGLIVLVYVMCVLLQKVGADI